MDIFLLKQAVFPMNMHGLLLMGKMPSGDIFVLSLQWVKGNPGVSCHPYAPASRWRVSVRTDALSLFGKASHSSCPARFPSNVVCSAHARTSPATRTHTCKHTHSCKHACMHTHMGTHSSTHTPGSEARGLSAESCRGLFVHI